MPTYTEAFLLVLCAAIAALGYGSQLSKLLRIDPNLGDRGILGLFTFGLLGCLLNFFTAISPGIHFAILAVGVLLAGIRAAQLRNSRIIWAAAVVIFLYVLTRPHFQLNYDSGLYYFQTLRWIRSFSIVPGLGNLHGRFGFNLGIFLIAAVVDQDGIGWVSNLLVVLFVLVSLFIRIRKVIANHRSSVEFWVLLLAILAFIEDRYVRSWYGVMNGDLFSAALIVYWTCVALGVSESSHLPTEIAVLMLSAALAAFSKTSALPLLLPAFALTWMHRKLVPAATLWRAATFAGLILGLWMLRGLTLSGCALYPMSATCITSLPWAESERAIAGESGSMRFWQRPGQGDIAKVIKDGTRLRHWIDATRNDRFLKLLIIFAPLGLISALLRRRLRGQPAYGPLPLVVAAGLTGCLLLWFLTAPDPRFGEGFILSAALLGGAVTFAACFDQPRFTAYVPAVILAAWALHIAIGVRNRVPRDYLGWELPVVPTYEFTDDRGNRIFVARHGDQCWNHPLPCTPYFDLPGLSKVRWPATLPAPPPGWKPEIPPPYVWTGVDGGR